jgi:hypothetical protein
VVKDTIYWTPAAVKKFFSNISNACEKKYLVVSAIVSNVFYERPPDPINCYVLQRWCHKNAAKPAEDK